MCDDIGITTEKKKVFLFSDGYDVSNIVFEDIEAVAEWIKNDEHGQDEDWEYSVKVAWMTETEIANLPEADL